MMFSRISDCQRGKETMIWITQNGNNRSLELLIIVTLRTNLKVSSPTTQGVEMYLQFFLPSIALYLKAVINLLLVAIVVMCVETKRLGK